MKGNGLMQQKYFSIVVVSLNSGVRLKNTLDSIVNQTFSEYEVILKDGLSTDHSLQELEEAGYFKKHPEIRVIQKKDTGIYDGMNQALCGVTGKFVEFLNCGDCFKDNMVLQRVHDFIEKQIIQTDRTYIFYGNQYNLIQGCMITSVPKINDFSCYRNVPCHQVCFYDRRLFIKRGYLPEYTVRADYEHFLYSIYKEKTIAVAMPIVICFYEGGGYSETKENRKHSASQHREITFKYLGKKASFYHIIMTLSGAPIRTFLSENARMSKWYNKLKSMFYKNQ